MIMVLGAAWKKVDAKVNTRTPRRRALAPAPFTIAALSDAQRCGLVPEEDRVLLLGNSIRDRG